MELKMADQNKKICLIWVKIGARSCRGGSITSQNKRRAPYVVNLTQQVELIEN